MVSDNHVLLGDWTLRGEEVIYGDVICWSIASGMRRERRDVVTVYSGCILGWIDFPVGGNGIGDAGLLVKRWSKPLAAARIGA